MANEERARRAEAPRDGRSGASITRRAFLGAGVFAALAWLAGGQLAWGVGGGGWGRVGATAASGNRYGFDSAWGYSKSRKVWLSVRCDATVGRMTELFLQISVKSYYANGGKWKPTWSTDYADTHVRSYVKEGSKMISSKTGFYDTTTDSSSYHGPYVTDVHRVERRASSWTSYAGVRAWCDSPDNANGIDISAEAKQIIPAHVLKHDASWTGRIVTVSPQSAPHLHMDASGGSVKKNANVVGWSDTHTTNQNWVVTKSPQGRAGFAAVHTGVNALFVDLTNGVWDDGANVELFTGNGSVAQSLWLHALGDGYHLCVFECSGCAIDLKGGGQENGTNFQQWNSNGNWTQKNYRMKLEEAVFKERAPGSFTVSGTPEPGGRLTPANPDETCYPYNYPTTSGMGHRFSWYRSEVAGRRGALVQGPSEDGAYPVTEADQGAYLTCVVTAFARYRATPYKGEVQSAAVRVPDARVAVRFFADGEGAPCFQLQAERSTVLSVPAGAWRAAAKPGCSGVDGWYVDAACAHAFADGSVLAGDLNLFARNRVKLAYAQTADSCLKRTDRHYYLDEALSAPVEERAVLPASQERYYGDRVSFARGTSAWFEDHGQVREAACESGAYADAAATGSPQKSVRLTCNTVAYLRWRTPAYDGIALS